jgi:hypothetical protein
MSNFLTLLLLVNGGLGLERFPSCPLVERRTAAASVKLRCILSISDHFNGECGSVFVSDSVDEPEMVTRPR